MKVRIVQAFTGYPDGTDASRRAFREGEELDDLPEAFAALIVAKGHAVERGPKPSAPFDQPHDKQG